MLRRVLIALALLALLCAGLAQAEDPGAYSTNCSRGESFSRTLTYRDSTGALVNLTGYTAKLQIRQRANDADPALLTLTEASGLTLGGPAGTIVWAMTPVQTLALPVGALVYDLRLTSGTGVVTFLLAGNLRVQERVTR